MPDVLNCSNAKSNQVLWEESLHNEEMYLTNRYTMSHDLKDLIKKKEDTVAGMPLYILLSLIILLQMGLHIKGQPEGSHLPAT